MYKNKLAFTHRSATPDDIKALLELEREWPEENRASEQQLLDRIYKFSDGFMIAEDATGIIGSIICYPYNYNESNDLTNFANWQTVMAKCYNTCDLPDTNGLYIVSGTTRKTHASSVLFDEGMRQVIRLGMKMKKKYVIAGCLLPGYARYLQKYNYISAEDYVFKKINGRFIDPLIEKYRKLDFYVPDKNHVIEDYYPDASSCNYSAIVIHAIITKKGIDHARECHQDFTSAA